MEDETLANVIELKRADIVLSTYEKSKESREVWMLVRDMEKLTLGNDGVLYRHTTDKKNWFPPKKLITLVFTELRDILVKTVHCSL